MQILPSVSAVYSAFSSAEKSILYRIYRVQSIFSIDVMVLIVILGEREAEITLQVFEHKAVEQIVANGS